MYIVIIKYILFIIRSRDIQIDLDILRVKIISEWRSGMLNHPIPYIVVELNLALGWNLLLVRAFVVSNLSRFRCSYSSCLRLVLRHLVNTHTMRFRFRKSSKIVVVCRIRFSKNSFGSSTITCISIILLEFWWCLNLIHSHFREIRS